MIFKASAMTAKKKSAKEAMLTPAELDEFVTQCESDIREHFQKGGRNKDDSIVKKIIARTSLALRKVLGP